jgi:hypothetical protein
MNKIKKFVGEIRVPAKLMVFGAIIIALLQMPSAGAAPASVLPLSTARVSVGTMEQVRGGRDTIVGVFFGSGVSTKEMQSNVNKQMQFVSSRKAYPASLAVIHKHEKTIRTKALKHGVPADVALGVGLLENGGSDTAVSSAGAVGVYQLMPGTARDLGLVVNKQVDQRRNPELNIDAGMRYLAKNYERFGDWGLSTWAYHAGEGNVAKALQLYAKGNHGVELPGINQPRALRAYVEKHDITIHKLLSDKHVKVLTNRLNDDSAGYPYKVVATATLMRQSKGGLASDSLKGFDIVSR